MRIEAEIWNPKMRHPNSSLFFYDEIPRFKLAFPCCPLLQK